MTQVHTRTVTSHAELVRAMIPQFIDSSECKGEDIFINNCASGIEFATHSGHRSAVVTGHGISIDCVRIVWTDHAHNERSWDEDITTHSLGSLFGVTEALVRFICDDKWPDFCTRHRKSSPRVTSFFDDKPYDTVDVVIQISSSLESLDLYRTFVDQKLTYKQDCGGYMHTIGHINDRPICIIPLIHNVGGVNVLYVEAQSALVDWQMIEDWVKHVVPEGTPMCTSPINALGYIRNAIHKKEGTTDV